MPSYKFRDTYISQSLPGHCLRLMVVNHAYQLLYLEQPEIHWHPPAQYAMAKCWRCRKQGARLVVETHSYLCCRCAARG